MHQSTDQRYIDAPKVLLHDHLDGGLRPATVVEIAAEVGTQLPADDPDELDRGSSTRRLGSAWSATWRRSTTRSR